MGRKSICAIASILALAISTQAAATPGVSLDSEVYVERTQPGNVRSLEPASSLRRGDRVVTVVTWRTLGKAGDFTVVNPVPRTITYENTAREDAEVSIDGGRTWGRLGELRFASRMATPQDVTHVRWRLPAARGSGRIAYSGIVR